MKLSDKDLKNIEKYAALFFTFKQIAILIDADIDEFITAVTDQKSNVFRAYQKGKLMKEAEIREQIIKMAEMGSPAAQDQALKLINKLKIENIADA